MMILYIIYLASHTKADLDNHANQLNPNNPRYAGHQERLAAEAAGREAAVLHQEAVAAYNYANQMEAGMNSFFLFFVIVDIIYSSHFFFSCFTSTSCCRSIKSTSFIIRTTSCYWC